MFWGQNYIQISAKNCHRWVFMATVHKKISVLAVINGHWSNLFTNYILKKETVSVHFAGNQISFPGISVQQNKRLCFCISLQITFGVIVMGRKTDTGTEGDVVFLLSPWVMSSPFRLCLHKVVAALSIHCRHGYSTASATLPSAEPPGATQAGHWSVCQTNRHLVQWERRWVM